MNSVTGTILVIEDEKHLAEGLKLNLTLQGHDVVVADNGIKALEEYEKRDWSLIIVDLMLPGIDGKQVIKKIRQKNEKMPILVLTARDEARMKVSCLELGVDDYLTKPFVLDELLLRVNRLIQRGDWSQERQGYGEEAPYYIFGENVVDFIHFTAKTRSGAINLTEQELKVLRLFFENPGTPLSRELLLEKGWGVHNVTSRTVDNFVVRLRKYFEKNPKEPIYFHSLRGVGYRFDPPQNGAFKKELP